MGTLVEEGEKENKYVEKKRDIIMEPLRRGKDLVICESGQGKV